MNPTRLGDAQSLGFAMLSPTYGLRQRNLRASSVQRARRIAALEIRNATCHNPHGMALPGHAALRGPIHAHRGPVLLESASPCARRGCACL